MVKEGRGTGSDRDCRTDGGTDELATDYWRDDEEETPNYFSDHMGIEVDFAVAER